MVVKAGPEMTMSLGLRCVRIFTLEHQGLLQEGKNEESLLV